MTHKPRGHILDLSIWSRSSQVIYTLLKQAKATLAQLPDYIKMYLNYVCGHAISVQLWVTVGACGACAPSHNWQVR